MTTIASMNLATNNDFAIKGVKTDDLVFYVTNPNQSIVYGLSNTPSLMTIKGSGNVGIGNSNPLYPLDVTGAAMFESNIYVNGVAVVHGDMQVQNTFHCQSIDFTSLTPDLYTTTSTGTLISGDGYFSGSNISLKNPLGTAMIQSTGCNIGLNTLNPNATLDIAGNLFVSKPSIFQSDLCVNGRLTVSNVQYITSNITIFNSEYINSNLNVLQTITASNIVLKGSSSNGIGMSVSNICTNNMSASNIAMNGYLSAPLINNARMIEFAGV